MRVTIVAFATLLAGSAFAFTGSGSELSSADEDFARTAAQANLAEVKVGQLAVQKGTTDQIRKMGQTMIDDHSKAQRRLESIANRKGFSLPTEPSSDQEDAYSRLSSLSGKDFDRAFDEEMKTDHQKAIALFRGEAQNGSDSQLKSFAHSTLPTLHHHEQMANRPLENL